MSISTLSERIALYAENSNIKLLPKLPVIISLELRSANRLTSLLPKPFHLPFNEAMSKAMVRLIQEVDGAVFGFSFSDEIVLVLRNDQSRETTPFYNNAAQRIASVSSSIATIEFAQSASSNDLQLLGDAVFVGSCFAVPNIGEAINAVISFQNRAISKAINQACLAALTTRYQIGEVLDTLARKSIQAKLDLLFEECGIRFEDYPEAFRRGVASYRIQKIIENDGVEVIRPKIILDGALPVFSSEPDFLRTILENGKDVLRR
jgi:tRNA(His) 5'-end guanylyltransferase